MCIRDRVAIATESRQAARPEPGKLRPLVKNVIAVSSGKGGVGKSTVAANLAVARRNPGIHSRHEARSVQNPHDRSDRRSADGERRGPPTAARVVASTAR